MGAIKVESCKGSRIATIIHVCLSPVTVMMSPRHLLSCEGGAVGRDEWQQPNTDNERLFTLILTPLLLFQMSFCL